MTGKNITFDHLIPDRGNLLLACGSIPQWVKNVRAELSFIYQQCGLDPLSMTDILHCSFARVTSLPQQFDSETYLAEINNLNEDVSKEGIPFTVGPVYRANPLSLMDRPI
jgi:hypothetical protein